MSLPCLRRLAAAAGAWLAVCAAAFLQPPPARAGVAYYDGWFQNRIGREVPIAPCAEGTVCEIGARPYAVEARAPSWTADWAQSRLFLAATDLSNMNGTPVDAPYTWACVVDPDGSPMEGHSAGILGIEGQTLDLDSLPGRHPLDFDPDDWPAYFGACGFMAAVFLAMGLCFCVAQRVPWPRLGDAPVQGNNATSEVLVVNLAEARAAHGVRQFHRPWGNGGPIPADTSRRRGSPRQRRLSKAECGASRSDIRRRTAGWAAR